MKNQIELFIENRNTNKVHITELIDTFKIPENEIRTNVVSLSQSKPALFYFEHSTGWIYIKVYEESRKTILWERYKMTGPAAFILTVIFGLFIYAVDGTTLDITHFAINLLFVFTTILILGILGVFIISTPNKSNETSVDKQMAIGLADFRFS